MILNLLCFDISLAVGVVNWLDVLVLDVVSGEDVLQGLVGFLREGGGSAEDLGVQGPAEVVGGSVVGRSAGGNDGVGLVVGGDDAGHVRLWKQFHSWIFQLELTKEVAKSC